MSLLISLSRYRQGGLAEPFVANRSLEGLNLALQTYMQSSMAGTEAGMEVLRAQLQPLIQPVENSELLSPDHLAKIRDFTDPEIHAGLSHAEVEDLAKRVGHVSYAVQQARAAVFVNGDNTETRRLARLTGNVRTSMPPSSSMGPLSQTVQIRPEGLENKIICTACSRSNDLDANFCQGCAKRIGLAKIKPEIIDATMLFTDIKGFTDFSDKLKPGPLIELMDDLLVDLRDTAVSKGAFQPNFWGDAMFAIYGLPQQSRKDSVNAVSTGLALQEVIKSWSERFFTIWDPTFLRNPRNEEEKKTLEEFSERIEECRREHRPVLQLRIGIHSGEVAAGSLAGLETVLGSAVNIAARLEPISPVGGMVISRETWERVKHKFDGKFLCKFKAKNIKEELEAFEVSRERSELSLLDLGPDQSTFVGRSEELDRLNAAFQMALSEKKSRLMIVVGEAGQGKSRLRSEFLRKVIKSDTETTILMAQGDQVETKIPYRSIAAAIRRWAEIGEKSLNEARRDLRSVLKRTMTGIPSDDLERHTHLIGNLIGIPFENPPLNIEPIFADPTELRERTLDALVELFDHIARKDPAVMIMEDLQWFDRGSIQYFRAILERLQERRAPIFVFGTARPEFLEPEEPLKTKNPLLEGNYLKDQIDLGKISEGGLSGIGMEMMGDQKIAPESMAFLVGRSDGNPFILQETVRAVKEGWLVDERLVAPDGKIATSLKDLSPLEIRRREAEGWARERRLLAPDGRTVPAGASRFLEERVASLLPEERELLKVAAVIGSEFSVEDVSSLGISNAENLIADLVRKKLLTQLGDGHYRFPHALLRDAVYNKLLPRDLRYHRLWAETLLKTRPQEQALTAHHFERGRDQVNAAHNYHEAAEKAYRSGATEAAIGFFRKAVELTADPKKRLKILRGWDEALYQAMRYEDQSKVHKLSLDTIGAMNAADVDPRDLAGVEFRRGRAINRSPSGNLEDAKRDLEEAFRSVENLPYAEKLMGNILVEMGVNLIYLGNLEEAEKIYKEAIRVGRSISIREPLVLSRALAGINTVCVTQGRFSSGIQYLDEAAQIYKNKRDIKRLVPVLIDLTLNYIRVGRYQEAEEKLREAIKVSEGYAATILNIEKLVPSLVRVRQLLGENEEVIDRSEKEISENSTKPFIEYTHIYLALACLSCSEWNKAREAAQQALMISRGRPRARRSIEVEQAAQMVLAQAFLKEGAKSSALEASRLSLPSLDEKDLEGKVDEFKYEKLLSHARILRENGYKEEASSVIATARRLLQKNAALLSDEHRNSFFRIDAHQEIENLYQLSREKEGSALDVALQNFLNSLARQLRVPKELPPELAFFNDEEGIVLKTDESHSGAVKVDYAGTVLHESPFSVVRRLFSDGIWVEWNPGPFFNGNKEGKKVNIGAENVLLTFSSNEDGNNPRASVEFDLESKQYPRMLGIMIRMGVIKQHFKVDLQGSTSFEDGVLKIEFKTENEETNLQKGIIGIQDFPPITFYICPAQEGHTRITVSALRADFTRHLESFISAFKERRSVRDFKSRQGKK